MRLDKEQALKLRLQGKSYAEIREALGVPKATLSAWFAHLELSEKAKEKIAARTHEKSTTALIQRNTLQTHLAEQRAREARISSKKEIKTLSKKELLLVGIALYWAEGYKRPKMYKGKVRTSHAVSLTNSDPNLVKVFLRFLREVCEVPEEKITANLRIYQHQSESYLLDFWSKITDISTNRFRAFYYSTKTLEENKKPVNTLPHGTIQVRVNNTELYHKIMGYIDGLAQQ